MTPISFTDLVSHPALLGPFFRDPSWDRWKAIGKAIFAEPMTDADIDLLREVAKRGAPEHPVSEAVILVGRGGGKDSIASALAVKIALGDYRDLLRPGEKASVVILAVDRHQAAIAFNYIRGYFEQCPVLAAMVTAIGGDYVELDNGVVIEVHTNSFRAIRGRRIIAAIADEVCFWRSDDSSNPDVEVYGALRPGLARTPGSLLIMISSVHKRSGLAYQRWRDGFGKDDPDTLVIVGTTTQLNPTFDEKVIAKDLARDPQLYGAEYLCHWRDDLSTFISRDLLDAAVDRGVLVRAAAAGTHYVSGCDPSGGRGDSFTFAVAHREKDLAVLDLLYERRAPFNPTEVVGEIVDLMKQYRCATTTGDKYAANWVTDAFAKVGARYVQSERDRSAIYLDALPLFTSGRARLVDNPRMVAQFAGLERRTFPTGRDRVDHPSNGSAMDDLSNSAALALTLAASKRSAIVIPPAAMARAAQRPASVNAFFTGGLQR